MQTVQANAQKPVLILWPLWGWDSPSTDSHLWSKWALLDGLHQENVCLFICGCSEGFVWPLSHSSSPLFLDHSLQPALIFDNKPRSNLSFVRQRAERRMCAVWDLNGDGGSAGSKERKYKTLGEPRFIQSAGMLFSRERLFSLCCWVGVPRICTSVSQSQLSSRRVITELCWWILILPQGHSCFNVWSLPLDFFGSERIMWFVLDNEMSGIIQFISQQFCINDQSW